MTIEEFIAGRLDEDEAGARAAAKRAGEWREIEGSVRGEPFWEAEPEFGITAGGETCVVSGEGFPLVAEAQHIARHDPARVLRQCAAMRDALWFAMAAFGQESKIQERPGRDPETNAYDSGRADTTRYMLRVLAAAWSDHPDFQEEWAIKIKPRTWTIEYK